MGLDMYLTAERYMSPYTGGIETERRINVITDQFPELRANGSTVKSVIAEVGYWRKANAIHNWFVQNIQDGVDECQKTYVSREQLQALLDTVNEVLSNKDEAGHLLPPKSGFFFGDTSIDQYYFDDMKNTKAILEAILTEGRFDSMWDFYYQSSW